MSDAFEGPGSVSDQHGGTDVIGSTGGSGGRVADTVVSVLLMLAQVGLWPIAFMLFIALPMSIDNCAYVDCGDEAWIGRAMWTAVGSIPVGVFFVGLAIYYLARRRVAFWAPLLGCVIQLTMLWGAYAMADLAGPI
ncbi:hypothetical protein [Mycolicibacterium sediminis]|uniref:Uncharacterized protein n=1 Tax=Mycolicibacterium sediminis TaxID=1286180 RepID=A0A7I7QP73_9MYCO|nr:hypothetical protein [Mycolicibacterium sediminis]BBY28173.1 hypothetical protein MSEDJ_22690 [Mycolicibacterium sediminis]